VHCTAPSSQPLEVVLVGTSVALEGVLWVVVSAVESVTVTLVMCSVVAVLLLH